jgi:3-hydroxyacyl-[acyl-carrier-protein] dehydratase
MRFEYFQMIDRIAALDLGERTVRSVCIVPKESTIFEGHFPGYPLMPGVLQIECMAQTCGWLVTAINRFSAMPFLIGVKEAKFRSPVLPGDELEFEGKVIHEGSGFTVGECKGRRRGKAICEAQITYRVMPFPNPQFRQAMVESAERIDVPVKELIKELSK